MESIIIKLSETYSRVSKRTNRLMISSIE